jgi:adenosylcobinamide-GDP ribazoletransferase
LLLALWAGLTGLLHLDGLMDSCDGLLPPRDPARRLEIMKDSRVGAFGVVGAILLLLIKFNALMVLLEGERGAVFKTAPLFYPAALITIPTLARWSMTWQMARYPLARQEGVSVFFKQGLGRAQLVGASVVAVSVTLGTTGWLGALLLAATWLTTTLLARLALARLGGLTGDVYGATCEVVETALLVVVASVPFLI